MNVTDSNKADFKQSSSQNMPQNTFQNASQNTNFFSSMIFRVFVLMLLLALSMIPISMLETLVGNQIKLKHKLTEELSNKWGSAQTIIGPILSIPYVEQISRIESETDSNGLKSSVSRDVFANKTLMLLPENLRINAKLKDKALTRDNHKVHVYQGEIELSGNFNLDALPLANDYYTIEWDKAFFSIGLSDNKSVEASTPLHWEDSSAAFKPGTQLPMLLKQGFHANLEDVANDNPLPQFKLQLNLRGKESFQFAPFGEITSAKIISDSSQIKIFGDIPASSKATSSEEFEATWGISNLSRNYPQQWLIGEKENKTPDYDFSSVLTGVQLSLPASATDENHAKIKDMLSYLMPILGILFLSLLIFEFKRNIRSKPKFIHYLVVSFPILLTPIILLTLNNLTSFIQAYQMAAGSSIILIVLYVSTALKSFDRGFYILLILATLFAALFVILEMPEYALFATSTAGLGITMLLMMASFNIQEDK